MSVRFRLITVDDVPEAMQLKDAAGWNQTSADWARFLSASPEGCFVADRRGRVVGTATSIVYEGRFAWIGMVIVAQQYRGQGIGTALLQSVIRYLDSRGVPCMSLQCPKKKGAKSAISVVSYPELPLPGYGLTLIPNCNAVCGNALGTSIYIRCSL
jgi:GNAT superfamily N-acetyltransferase